jgi:hypothetical protein
MCDAVTFFPQFCIIETRSTCNAVLLNLGDGDIDDAVVRVGVVVLDGTTTNAVVVVVIDNIIKANTDNMVMTNRIKENEDNIAFFCSAFFL